MSGVWLASYICLWILVGFLLLATFALARQVGLLLRRLPATGARMTEAGPDVGDQIPALNVEDLDGRLLSLRSNDRRRTLLAFVSPTCDVCREITPALRALSRTEQRNVQVIVISLAGGEAINRRFREDHHLTSLPFVVAPELREKLRVNSHPYAILADPQGIVRAKGLVNNREHLDSLFRAEELGYPSVEGLHGLADTDRHESQARGI